MKQVKLNVSIIATLIYTSLLGQTFTPFTPANISSNTGDWRSIAPVDIDNDYNLDLVIGNNGANTLYINNGDSTMTEDPSNNCVSQAIGGSFSMWADVDNDCDLDVFWPTNGTANNVFLRNQGDGNFVKENSGTLVTSGIACAAAAWADVNNDGWIDLLACDRFGGTNYLFINNNGTSFTRIDTGTIANSTGTIWGCAFADIDNDNDPDLFLANQSGNNFLLINEGGLYFRHDTTSIISQEGNSSVSGTFGDYDNDGDLDLYVGRNQFVSNYLYTNDGLGNFTKVSSGPGLSSNLNTGTTSWVDFDNDGDLDLYAPHTGGSASKRNLIYRNDGASGFTTISSGPVYSEFLSTEGAIVADINNDGWMDILNANRFAANSLFLNNGGSKNFFKCQLFGSSSNLAAIGARIKLVTGTRTQIRYIGQQSGRLSHKSLEIHFGLDQDTIIDSLVVMWPSGSQCTFLNITANTYYNIGESSCTLDTVINSDFSQSSQYLTANFTDQSIGGVGQYHWDFGDGDTSNFQNPQHSYPSPGDYEVTLTIYDNYCRRRVFSDSISICPDTSTLGFFASSLGRSVTFVDTSISNGYQFSWDYGDGQTGQGPINNHTYNTAGVYWVCLSVTDSCRTKQYCDSVTVCNDTIISNFSFSTTALQVSFSDSSQNAQSLLWDFGDGTTSTAPNPNHIYSAPGYYLVCLTATGICNSSVYCDSIGVCLDTAKADFNWNANGNLVSFTDASTNAKSYYWDFGDGGFSTQVNPTHFYLANGTYNVCLAVTNDCFTDTICQTITLCDFNLDAGYSYTTLFSPVAIQFQDTSIDAISWYWDFDDGSTSTNQNPVNVFGGGQVYNVCLTVTDSCGSTDSACQAIDLTKFDISDLSSGLFTEIYPVPARGRLTIHSSHTPYRYEIYDITGSVVIKGDSKDRESDISTIPLASGIYFVQIQSSNGIAIHRMVVE